MRKINRKIFYGYALLVFVLSIYINSLYVNLFGFLLLSTLTFGCFISVYFLIKNFKSFSKFKKVLSVFGIFALFFLIYLFGVLGYFSGFHSSDCYGIEAKNIFTGSEKRYCNFPPWYTDIGLETNEITGEVFVHLMGNNISAICDKSRFDSLRRYCERNIN